jgi:enoyl-CoA hydratase/carnithine racemase
MERDEITYEVDPSGVVVVTLDRPKILNAISARPGGTRDQIIDAIEEAEADSVVGCVVLRGEGRAFCGGGDLTGNAKRETLAEQQAFVASANEFHERLMSSAVPTIAAVHGYCLGAGVLLAASCDFVLASESATFGFPEGRIGLVGATALTTRIGRQWTKFLTLSGESVTAEQARDLGLVLTVESDESLHDRAIDLAGRIARMPRQSVMLNRRAIDNAADAAGDAAARAIAVTNDAETLDAASLATAPDGRTFRSIIEAEGIEGLKQARKAQYDSPWLG